MGPKLNLPNAPPLPSPSSSSSALAILAQVSIAHSLQKYNANILLQECSASIVLFWYVDLINANKPRIVFENINYGDPKFLVTMQ